MARKKILIAGASGLVGYAAMKHFAGSGDCEVIAVSRRAPIETHGARFIPLDLTDEKRCAEVIGDIEDVTHLVYAALYEKPGLIPGWLEEDHIETNQRMLRNLFEPLERSSPGLRWVGLLQGTKAYGIHVRPFPVPAREDRSEMHDHPNFYWQQESYVRDQQKGSSWHFTIFRPQIIFGMSLGSAMNLIPAIGTYAALLKEEGKPLAYPGGPCNAHEAVDADLLARAIAWAADAEAARNQSFNVTNGDVFVWHNVWPAIADALGMEPGPDQPYSMSERMPARAAEWDRIRAKYNLRSPGLKELVGESFYYADYCMAHGMDRQGPPVLVSTIKLRQAGFHEVMDTEAMFRKWFRIFREMRLLPPG